MITEIVFVGTHHKTGLPALCSSTRTGKIVDLIIYLLPTEYTCKKTNLFDLDYMPTGELKRSQISEFVERASDSRLYVLLGRVVRECLYNQLSNRIHITHPSYISRQGRNATLEYIKDVHYRILKAAAGG